MSRPDPEEVELELFVRAMQMRHGYDFSQYARASFRRRVLNLVHMQGLGSIGELTARALRDDAFVVQVVSGLSVPVSEMFRNPDVFRALSTEVFPLLASYSQLNIWQAGCAFGEEVYSLAILLEEAGLYDRSQIYATDFNEAALARAREGIFPAREARAYSENYLAAGGKQTFSDYYHARYEHIRLDQRLTRNMTFASHNLVADGVFCEAHLILCRNVLIYFTDPLQNRVLRLFRDSLARGGFLCLGNKETLDFAPVANEFIALNAQARIFRLGAHAV